MPSALHRQTVAHVHSHSAEEIGVKLTWDTWDIALGRLALLSTRAALLLFCSLAFPLVLCVTTASRCRGFSSLLFVDQLKKEPPWVWLYRPALRTRGCWTPDRLVLTQWPQCLSSAAAALSCLASLTRSFPTFNRPISSCVLSSLLISLSAFSKYLFFFFFSKSGIVFASLCIFPLRLSLFGIPKCHMM